MTAAEYFGGRSFIDRTYPANHPMRELLVTSNPSTTTVAAFDCVYMAGDRHWLEGAKRDIDAIPNPGSALMAMLLLLIRFWVSFVPMRTCFGFPDILLHRRGEGKRDRTLH